MVRTPSTEGVQELFLIIGNKDNLCVSYFKTPYCIHKFFTIMNKRILQVITSIFGVVSIVIGLVGYAGLKDPIYGDLSKVNNILLDSNLRFFNGIWIGIGVALLSTVKHIDTETKLYRVIWLCIFLGGIGRLLSIFFGGAPPAAFISFTIFGIVGAPLFIYWQSTIAKAKKWDT